MHTFGFPCRIEEIIEVANKYNIPVIEDAAESLGSYYSPREIKSFTEDANKDKIISRGRHTGSFGLAGILSTMETKLLPPAAGE